MMFLMYQIFLLVDDNTIRTVVEYFDERHIAFLLYVRNYHKLFGKEEHGEKNCTYQQSNLLISVNLPILTYCEKRYLFDITKYSRSYSYVSVNSVGDFVILNSRKVFLFLLLGISVKVTKILCFSFYLYWSSDPERIFAP